MTSWVKKRGFIFALILGRVDIHAVKLANNEPSFNEACEFYKQQIATLFQSKDIQSSQI